MPWFRRQLCLPGAFFAGRRTGCSEEASGQPWARWGRQPSPSVDTQCPHEPPSLPPVPTSGQPDFWGLWHPQNRVPEEGRARFPRCLPNSRIRRELGKKLAGEKKIKKLAGKASSELNPSGFLQPPAPRYESWGIQPQKCPFLLCLTYSLLPVGSCGGSCSSRAFASESPAFALLVVSRRLEVLLARAGCFGTGAAFYGLL